MCVERIKQCVSATGGYFLVHTKIVFLFSNVNNYVHRMRGYTHTHTYWESLLGYVKRKGPFRWGGWQRRLDKYLNEENNNKKNKKQGRRSYSRRPPLFPVNTQWLPSRCFWVLVLQANFHVCVCVYCFSFSRWCLYRSSTNTLARDVCVCGKRQLRSSSRSNTCCIHLSIGYIR